MIGALENLKIRNALLLGFGTLWLLLALSDSLSILRAGEVRSGIRLSVDLRVPTMVNGMSLARNVEQALANLRGFMLTGDGNFKALRRGAWEEIAERSTQMDSLAANWTNTANREAWTKIRPTLTELKSCQDRIEALPLTEDGRKEALALLKAECFPRASAISDTLLGQADPTGRREGGIIGSQRQLLTDTGRANEDAVSGMITLLIVLLLIGASVGVAAALMLVRLTAHPINRLTGTMERLADGKLETAVEFTERRNEIGAMAKTLLVFRDNMARARDLAAKEMEAQRQQTVRAQAIEQMTRKFEQDVSSVLTKVGALSDQLRGTSAQMSATAEETSRQASVVAAASEEASTNVQTVAAATEELSASVGEISRQVTEANGIARAAQSEVSVTNDRVKELEEAATRIGDVIRLINEIAGQTNLLALNATIEAARAGEAGKGFAVVASEVKNLAGQTSRATGDIEQQIAAIQAATRAAAAAMEGVGETIGRINQISGMIAAAVEQQSAATSEIAGNVQQAAIGTREVAQNIVGVTQASRDTGHASSEVSTASQQLSGEMSGLQQLVGGFLTKVRTA